MVTVLFEFLKEVFLEKRPHFLHACRPVQLGDLNETFLCDLPAVRAGDLVTSYQCSKPKGHRSFTSFPSGHASLATYCGSFVAGYIVWRGAAVVTAAVVRIVLVVVTVVFGTFVSLSRIWDHMHFWWDVMFGACAGAAFSLWMLACPPV